MKSTTRAYAALLTLLVAGFTSANAFGQGTASQSDIQARYDQLDNILVHQDAAAAMKYYAPSLKFMDMMGKPMTYAQYGPYLAQEIRGAQSVSSKTTIQTFAAASDGATATVKEIIELTMINPKTVFLDTIQGTVMERDHWIEVGGEWKINRARVLSYSFMTNGKSMKMM